MELQNFLKKHPELEEDYVVDTGTVIGAYGLRDPQDLDLVCKKEKADLFRITTNLIDIHNRERIEHG